MDSSLEWAVTHTYDTGTFRDAEARTWAWAQEKSELVETNRRLRCELARLQQLVYLDELTGLGNRRRFNDTVASELSRAARCGHPLTLLILDVDHFKECNDNYGHEAGDSLLVHISRILRQSCRRGGDLAVRYAGDEFALVLPLVQEGAAREIAEQTRQEIHSLSPWHPLVPRCHRASVSIGGATFRSRDRCTPAMLAGVADEALYRAKRAGRNRVAFAES